MKKALLLFGFLSATLSFQSCTTDTDDMRAKEEPKNTYSVTDTITPPIYTTTTNLGTDNGDLGKDPGKKK